MARILASTVSCVFTGASFGIGPVAAPPAPTPVPPAARPAVSSSPLIGYYTLTRAGADAMQLLTLRLRADGIASLRTATPGYTQTAAGTPVTPVYETGAWMLKEGRVAVHFDMTSSIVDRVPTNPRRESVDLTFALTGCTLKLTSDPAKAYGSNGLTFTKEQCTP